MIQAKNIAFEVNGRTIVEVPDFHTTEPEFIVILGPNGAGKSTLLKMLSGGISSGKGTVSYFGKELTKWKLTDLAQVRAYMHQESIIAADFTVRQVLEMALYLAEKVSDNTKKLETVARDMNLFPLLDRVFNSLSGGEKQRVQFGRALLQLEKQAGQAQKYLFLDEPLNNLDIRYQIELMQLARSFVDAGEGTVIVVLHDINLCNQFADRVVLLEKGRIVADGSVEEVLLPETLSAVYNVSLEKSVSLDGIPFFRHQTAANHHFFNQLNRKEQVWKQ